MYDTRIIIIIILNEASRYRLFDVVRTPYVYIQVNEHVTAHLTFNIDKTELLCRILARATTVTNKKITK